MRPPAASNGPSGPSLATALSYSPVCDAGRLGAAMRGLHGPSAAEARDNASHGRPGASGTANETTLTCGACMTPPSSLRRASCQAASADLTKRHSVCMELSRHRRYAQRPKDCKEGMPLPARLLQAAGFSVARATVKPRAHLYIKGLYSFSRGRCICHHKRLRTTCHARRVIRRRPWLAFLVRMPRWLTARAMAHGVPR